MDLSNNEINQASPFGIYSPYGEFSLDKSEFASQSDISEHLLDLGVKWVQEVSVYKGMGTIPLTINLYSRIGREGGMIPQKIDDPNIIECYKTELSQTITNMGNRVKFWEVDTEPDGIGGWSHNPNGYANLLKMTHSVIKSKCPDCKVMFGGLSGGQAVLDIQGLTFLERVLESGAAGYFDGLEFKRHHTSSQDYSLLKSHFSSIKNILSKYRIDIHKIPVFLETAMYDGDPNDPVPNPLVRDLSVQSEVEQAIGMIKTYVYGLSLGIEKIFWNLIYERSDYEPGHTQPFPQNPFNHYGLINNPTNSDGLSHKKLAYYAYKKMVEILDGSDWNGVQVIQESDDIFIAKFTNRNRPIYVAWWDYFKQPGRDPNKSNQVTLTGLRGNQVRITTAVPVNASGKDIVDYTNGFQEEVLPVQNGKLSLTLGASPVFIESHELIHSD
ncbi:MAG: hypothetical protein IH585_01480 [Anaerolineaceae bacterium]|nr:hypothetical protein [Anaerolineaceae bacterium]